jgi:pimeloyl-ACP methyl ester carboxylesterase
MSTLTTNRTGRLVAIGAVLVVLMTCGVSAGAAGPAKQEARPASTSTVLAWGPCGDGAAGWECATLAVPRDYADPTGPTIDVALTRLRAGSPARRIGALVVNPGGPGGGAVSFLHGYAAAFFPDETRARFDLIGFDSRGVEASGQIDCRADLDTYDALDPSPDNAAEWQAWLAGGRDYAAACAANAGALLPFMGTENVVSDMERVRVALGEEKLSFLGFSWGTNLGARYADRYPDRVRAFALDSPLLTFSDVAGLLPQWVSGYERSFDVFLADCAAAQTCPFHAGGNPGAAYDALMTKLDATPLEVGGKGAARQVGQHAVLDAVDDLLSNPTTWPRLASALAAAAGGDGSAVLALADERNGRQADGTYGPGYSVFLAVSCLDFPVTHDPAAFEALATKAAVIAPRLGAYYATQIVPCVYWPTPPTPAAAPPVAHGAPPILLVGATLDTRDPYQWALDMAGQLESAVLLTREGTGHTSYALSACAEDAINAYLLDLKLPAPGLVCPSTGGLFERLG